MTIRRYQPERDLQACLRIYREAGWVDEKDHERASEELFKDSNAWVAELHGSAECLVHTMPGSLRYQETDLLFSGVTGVTTSRIARKQGWAGRLTARALAEDAVSGCAVAILGMFEQGYYDQLGFGTGSYDHWCALDPSTLQIPVKPSVPVRLGKDDWQAMHESRLQRIRYHGSCSIHSPTLTLADILWSEGGFGLGYLDEQGNVTHHFWCSSKGEHGPYRIHWMTYQNRAQFLELMALIRNLGDQVHSVKLAEPPHIQLQDFIKEPFKLRKLTHRSAYESKMSASAYSQVRILDLMPCIAAIQWNGAPIRFTLELTDPIETWVSEDCTWKGVGGEYTVTLASESSVEAGATADLPVLKASINAFSRMWLGVRPATSLSWSDDLQAPPSLLDQLDRAFLLPQPNPDWDF